MSVRPGLPAPAPSPAGGASPTGGLVTKAVAAGISYDEIAKALNVPVDFLKQYEATGQPPPPPNVLAQLQKLATGDRSALAPAGPPSPAGPPAPRGPMPPMPGMRR